MKVKIIIDNDAWWGRYLAAIQKSHDLLKKNVGFLDFEQGCCE